MGLPDGLGSPALLLDPSPAPWRSPGDTAQPIRPVPYNGGGVVPRSPRRPEERKRVLISLGLATVRLNGLPLIQHLIDAFRRAGGSRPSHRAQQRAATDLLAETHRMPMPAQVVPVLEQLARHDPASMAPPPAPAIVGTSS